MFTDKDIAEMLRLLKKIDEDVIALTSYFILPLPYKESELIKPSEVKVPKRRGRPPKVKGTRINVEPR